MWAFSDESERGERMLMAVVFVPISALAGARTELRKLLLPGQRRLHTRLESPRRRRVLLDTLSRLDAAALVLRTRRSARTDARRLLLTAVGAEVLERRAIRWVLDDVEPVQRSRDLEAVRGMFGRAGPSYDHRPGHTEPLLWAADAVCWAVGAGRDWRRRIDGLVELRDLP